MSLRCPVCGSSDVRRQSTSLARPEGSPFASLALIEMYCNNCKTLEDRRTDAKDFPAFEQRWMAPAG